VKGGGSKEGGRGAEGGGDHEGESSGGDTVKEGASCRSDSMSGVKGKGETD
jgi:hypothetical protein